MSKLKLEDIVIQSFITSDISASNKATGPVTIPEPNPATFDIATTQHDTATYTKAGDCLIPPQCKTEKYQTCEACMLSRNNMLTGNLLCPQQWSNYPGGGCRQSANTNYCTDNTHINFCAGWGGGGIGNVGTISGGNNGCVYTSNPSECVSADFTKDACHGETGLGLGSRKICDSRTLGDECKSHDCVTRDLLVGSWGYCFKQDW